jgi:hypothetical protein
MPNLSNKSNATELEVFSSNEELINLILSRYILDGILAIGMILNLISILVFFKIIKQESSNQGHMFKYLLMKCICDFFVFLLFIPEKVLNDGNYIQVLFKKWNYYFFENILSTSSSFYEIASSLDCLFLISRKVKWFKKKSIFYIVVLFLTFSTVMYYTTGLFRFEITKNQNGDYYLKETSFKSSLFIRRYFLSFHTSFRDAMPLIISFIINSIIIYYLRQRTHMRLTLSSNKQTSLVANAYASELKKIKLTIFTSLIVLLRVPESLNILFFSLKDNIFSNLSTILKYISFFSSFFGFLLYNSNFRKIFTEFFIILFNLFRKI